MTDKGAKLEVLVCTECSHVAMAPIVSCPSCMSRSFEAQQLQGKARLLSWTVIRKPPERFAAEGAYVVCVADVDGKIKVTGRLPSGLIDEHIPAPELGSEIVYAGIENGVHQFELADVAMAGSVKREARAY